MAMEVGLVVVVVVVVVVVIEEFGGAKGAMVVIRVKSRRKEHTVITLHIRWCAYSCVYEWC